MQVPGARRSFSSMLGKMRPKSLIPSTRQILLTRYFLLASPSAAAHTHAQYLDAKFHLGEVDMATVALEEKRADPSEEARLERIKHMPPLENCYNLSDFEFVAKQVMKGIAWGYYSSGADDEITMRENRTAFHKIWFRPRVLVDVEKVDTACTMLGSPSALPFYVTATALGKLGHPDGETVLTRAAARHGVIQMIPTLASCSFDEIVDAADGKQTQWFQLYVNRDRGITARIVRHAEARGCKGLFITVDAPQLGRREKDDLGTISDSWVNQHRASTHDPGR